MHYGIATDVFGGGDGLESLEQLMHHNNLASGLELIEYTLEKRRRDWHLYVATGDLAKDLASAIAFHTKTGSEDVSIDYLLMTERDYEPDNSEIMDNTKIIQRAVLEGKTVETGSNSLNALGAIGGALFAVAANTAMDAPPILHYVMTPIAATLGFLLVRAVTSTMGYSEYQELAAVNQMQNPQQYLYGQLAASKIYNYMNQHNPGFLTDIKGPNIK